MNNRKELLLQKVQRAGGPSDADRRELFNLLDRNDSLQRMICSILQVSDEAVTLLAGADLSTDKGVKDAIKIQSRAKALALVVDDLLDFATTEPEPEAPKPQEAQDDKSK